ncbi:MAG: peptide chain release factor N(5)-glutamine methyltransferase [Candidatus Omnitrophota bacterium]
MERSIDLIKEGRSCLEQHDIPNSGGESELLLGHILNCSRLELYLDNRQISEENLCLFRDLLKKRVTGIPLQYLLGCTEFMGLKIKTAFNVFIPRPETEILVEAVLDMAAEYGRQCSILDIGTGSGNIAVSLAKYIKNADVFACDISDFALQLARDNALLNNARINVIKSDLFSAFKQTEQFSLVVSNPPYIKTADIPKLSPEVQWEPRAALDAGGDGLFYYYRIIDESADYMREEALLVLEIGDNQYAAVKNIIEQSQCFTFVKVVNDNNNKERIIIARKIRKIR